ncbi:MAG TPA: ATP-binding cassette domain-containing protein [Mycobacteriales bacterium]|nr:ATP-binding cassette domain-containing protein [Mycobacteriales bacterium]
MSAVLEGRGLSKRYRGGDGSFALQDVDVCVQPGEIVAIVGRNGAGKSTLLKLAGGVTTPTTGTLHRAQRVAPLIEVGAGFHPELSGRDNVGVNARLLGMSGRQVKHCFDDIVDFAELGHVIDRPVKEYSSGMYMRLGFAVAVHTDPELLLVDEVLAVGDLPFQVKCLDRIRTMRDAGVGILFVSHNLAAVADIAARCLLLEGGRLECEGQPNEVIASYHKALERRVPSTGAAVADVGAGLSLLDVELVSPATDEPPVVWRPSERAELRLRLRADVETPSMVFGLQVNSESIGLCQRWHPDSSALPAMNPGDVVDVRLGLTLAMGPGGYSVDVAVAASDWSRILLSKPAAVSFAISARSGARGPMDLDPSIAVTPTASAELRS